MGTKKNKHLDRHSARAINALSAHLNCMFVQAMNVPSLHVITRKSREREHKISAVCIVRVRDDASLSQVQHWGSVFLTEALAWATLDAAAAFRVSAYVATYLPLDDVILFYDNLGGILTEETTSTGSYALLLKDAEVLSCSKTKRRNTEQYCSATQSDVVNDLQSVDSQVRKRMQRRAEMAGGQPVSTSTGNGTTSARSTQTKRRGHGVQSARHPSRKRR